MVLENPRDFLKYTKGTKAIKIRYYSSEGVLIGADYIIEDDNSSEEFEQLREEANNCRTLFDYIRIKRA